MPMSPARSSTPRPGPFCVVPRLSLSAFPVLLVFLICAAAPPAQAQPPSPSALNSDASLAVNIGKVQHSDFTRYLSLNGTINAWQEVVIAAEVGGYRVEEVLVDVGDYVQPGQELVRLSTSLLQTDVASRRATLKQRDAEAVNANLALQRAQPLAEQNLLSPADLDRLKSEAAAAAGRVEAAKADLEAAEVRLRFARVKAPDAGVISSRSISVGQVAQAGSELLRMLRQNRVEWRGAVPEGDLPALQVGQQVTITSVDGREHYGTIRIVAPTVDPNTHNGLVYVDVPSDDALRPGMFARGRIEVSKGKALVVPLNSLVSSDGYHYVFVLDEERRVRRQAIETGVIQGDVIEVLAGLREGMRIVVSGAGFLKDGDLVNVIGDN